MSTGRIFITPECVRHSQGENLLKRQARVLIEDAENHRSIFHKLDEKSLDLYELSYSRFIIWIRRLALAILALLPFFEWPSSLTMSSDVRLNLMRPRLPCGVTESVEAFCILVLIVDSACLAIASGKTALLHNPWLLGRFLLFPIYGTDFFVSLGLRCNEFYRIRRFLRPYFLISGSQMMKKLLKCIKNTLLKLLSTLFLLLFWLVCATLVALCLFSRPHAHELLAESNTSTLSSSFPDFYTSMYNLLILLTTANHPDVVLDVYTRNRAAAIFVIVFLGIGLYVFMNILTAIVYSEFRGYLMSSVQTRLTRRRVATRAAFEILKQMNNNSDLASSDDIIHLITTSHFSSSKKDALRENYIALFAESDLTAAQFLQLFRTLDHTEPLCQESGLRTVRPGFHQSLQAWIVSSSFSKLSVAVSFLNIINLAVDLSERVTSSTEVGFEMRIVNWCFVTFYVVEQVCLIWAYEPRTFFSKPANVFAVITVLFLLISKFVELGYLIFEMRGHVVFLNFTLWDMVRLTNILLLTRAMRVVQLFPWTRLVAGVLIDLPGNLAPVLGILATAYYVYALLGMNLFSGVIRYDPNATITYECGTYQQLQYWSVNFDDFASSLVLLWDLMVVNNWFVIVNAYQQAVNTWVHVYMISWWLLAVVGLLSLVTAFVIETFLHRRDLYFKAQTLLDKSHEVIVQPGTCFVVPFHPPPHSDPPTSPYPNNSTQIPVVPDSQRTESGYETSQLSVQSTEDLVCVQPFTQSYQRCSIAIHTSTLDEIFRSDLHEPSEADLVHQLAQHDHFRSCSKPAPSPVAHIP